MESWRKGANMETKHSIIGWLEDEHMKSSAVSPPFARVACFKFWAIVATIMLILLVCALQLVMLDHAIIVEKFFPSERVYENNGYLIISSNGELNQMRTGISDMVAIAKYLNVTLLVPEMDTNSYWKEPSKFADIFDVDYFIVSLRDEVRILKSLPPEQKRIVELPESLCSMYPESWSSLTYYHDKILPRIKQHQILHFTQTDSRLANNGLPNDLQKLRCRVNYDALRFTAQTEETGKKIVRILRQKGPFLALHLQYEKDMLALLGCNEGSSDKEIEDLTNMRYSHPGWKHMVINSKRRRSYGFCPLTPEETALALRALDIDRNMQIYIAAGHEYGDEERMQSLATAYPNMIRKETVLELSDLMDFKNHSNQMAALDYIVALESDIFVPTFEGNIAKSIEGHRRYLGFRTTIIPNRKLLVSLIDEYRNGRLSWDEFSEVVKAAHANQMGKPTKRLEVSGRPLEEESFYSNPMECLPPIPPQSISV